MMRIFRYFINLDKEEKWLNELAAQGQLLTSKSGAVYRFEKAEPGSAVIRIDYRTFRRSDDFEDYRALFEDSGWRHVAGTKSSGAQYFCKQSTDRSEDIFSDADSKAGRFKRLSEMWQSLAFCYIPIFAALVSTGSIDASALLHPAELYYTPGLWERSGADFWSAFLFETPFAVGRGLVWLFLPLSIVLALSFAAKARLQYKRTSENNLR